MIGTTHSGAVAYDLPGSENARILWGTGRGSYQRTGLAPDQPAALVVEPTTLPAGVEAGGTVALTLSLTGSYTGTITLSDTVPANFDKVWSATTVTLPAEVTLTLTDTHPAGPLIPGVWYSFDITATGGENVQVLNFDLLVGGVRAYLPLIIR